MDAVWTSCDDVTVTEVVMETTTEDRGIITFDADLTLQILYGVIGTLGIVDNAFVLLVVGRTASIKTTLFGKFLLNQSSIDMSAGLFLVLTTYIRSLNSTWLGEELFCRLWMSKVPVWSMCLASTYNLVALTFERYVAIVHPLKRSRILTARRAYFLMVFAWTFGIGYNCAYMATTSTVVGGECSVVAIWPSSTVQKAVGILTVFLQYILPLIVITIFYVFIITTLRRNTKTDSQTELYSSNRDKILSRARRNVVKTLALVFACFIVCWTWNQVYYLMYNLGYDDINFTGTFYHFTVIMVFLNCCLNPIVYSIQYKKFQMAARSLFCPKRAPRDLDVMSTQSPQLEPSVDENHM